jgi:hypothetical protein
MLSRPNRVGSRFFGPLEGVGEVGSGCMALGDATLVPSDWPLSMAQRVPFGLARDEAFAPEELRHPGAPGGADSLRGPRQHGLPGVVRGKAR